MCKIKNIKVYKLNLYFNIFYTFIIIFYGYLFYLLVVYKYLTLYFF